MEEELEIVFAAEVRRPELMRWVVLLSIAGLVVLSVIAGIAGLAKSPLVPLILFSFAAVVGWFGKALLFTNASRVRFDGETVSDDTGEVICRLEDIKQIERGLALWKPTNGFVLTLHEPVKERGWSPGLWWRLGKRVGIGGATPGRAPRSMADAINLAMMKAKGEI